MWKQGSLAALLLRVIAMVAGIVPETCLNPPPGTRRNSERAEPSDNVQLERIYISAAAELSHNMGTDGDIYCFEVSRNMMTENMGHLTIWGADIDCVGL
jgi:hypothetical protein